jgi:hypothetical protein
MRKVAKYGVLFLLGFLVCYVLVSWQPSKAGQTSTVFVMLANLGAEGTQLPTGRRVVGFSCVGTTEESVGRSPAADCYIATQ